MAKVQQVCECPKCSYEIYTDVCGNCGFRWKGNVPEYEKPNYISYQKDSVRVPKEEWFMNCSHDAHLAAMEDAFDVVRYILFSNSPKDHISEVTKKAQAIGNLAKAIENLAATGGFIPHAKIRNRVTSEDNSEEATRTRY